MASINFTNRKAAQALRGQSVIVTVNAADSVNIYQLRAGQLATHGSSGKTGTVGFIDVYGISFKVNPIQPDRTFDSASVYGYLAVGDVVTVTVP